MSLSSRFAVLFRRHLLPTRVPPGRCFGTRGDRPKVVIQKLGDLPYGSREYRLVLQRPKSEAISEEEEETSTPLASIRAHRNVVFGAQFLGEPAQNMTLTDACLPLLDAALKDASEDGEQPQAMATLHGLCGYVTDCLEASDSSSEALQKIQDDSVSFQAIQAIATGIPREGHTVVGQGTFRDGEAAWEQLAQEFIDKQLAEEVELYRARRGTVVGIEHLADTNPKYLRSAGGAMARLFFV